MQTIKQPRPIPSWHGWSWWRVWWFRLRKSMEHCSDCREHWYTCFYLGLLTISCTYQRLDNNFWFYDDCGGNNWLWTLFALSGTGKISGFYFVFQFWPGQKNRSFKMQIRQTKLAPLRYSIRNRPGIEIQFLTPCKSLWLNAPFGDLKGLWEILWYSGVARLSHLIRSKSFTFLVEDVFQVSSSKCGRSDGCVLLPVLTCSLIFLQL